MPRAALKSKRSKQRRRVHAPFPGFIEQCDPTLRDDPPRGPGWLHEIKHDGYRVQLHMRDGGVRLYSRTAKDWTTQFIPIAKSGGVLAAQDAILDGEAVVLNAQGVADLQALRREIGKDTSERLTYHAFDLLHLDGADLRALPLIERKERLRTLLEGAPNNLVYVDHLFAEGPRVFRSACELGLEGVVSKREESPYRSGRQDDWIKTKCIKSDSFPIIAFVEKLGAKPRRIASLYVGRRDERGRLLYAGKVRSGYSSADLLEIRERLNPLISKRSPLDVPAKKEKATWVKPEVLAEVQYSNVTESGLLREAVFKGLRDDLAPLEPRTIRAPRLVPAKALRGRPAQADKPHIGVPRENILQLLPEAVVPTREQLAEYWARMWRIALPQLGHRPLKLVRHVHGTTFYHKGPLPPIPKAVHQLRLQKREGGEGVRLWVESLGGLLGLVEIGAVELHAWNATAEDIEHADRLVFDLDPGEGIAWEFVIDTALALREMLLSEGFNSWPKITGGKGLHIIAPLADKMTHDKAHAYTHAIAQKLAQTAPERYVTSAALAKRPGKLFIDYLRNGRGTTAIGAYSPRAREGFPVAAPVTWKDVEKGIAPDALTMSSFPTPPHSSRPGRAKPAPRRGSA
jgi:bifunctional non-homologous end joining protein LigD